MLNSHSLANTLPSASLTITAPGVRRPAFHFSCMCDLDRRPHLIASAPSLYSEVVVDAVSDTVMRRLYSVQGRT